MFSDRTHHDGRFLGDGLWADITTGKLRSVGQTAFHSRNEVLAMYGPGWEILELIHQECTIFETDEPDGYPYAEWFVIARKRA
jgi:hypothetical protein